MTAATTAVIDTAFDEAISDLVPVVGVKAAPARRSGGLVPPTTVGTAPPRPRRAPGASPGRSRGR